MARLAGRYRYQPWDRWARSVVAVGATPQDIALGAAVTLFVAFTPTIGFQVVLAVFLATVMGASRTAAVIPVWITNPLTAGPIFAFTYRVGRTLWPGSPDRAMADLIVALSRHVASDQWCPVQVV